MKELMDPEPNSSFCSQVKQSMKQKPFLHVSFALTISRKYENIAEVLHSYGSMRLVH